jgi:hypothetical protein
MVNRVLRVIILNMRIYHISDEINIMFDSDEKYEIFLGGFLK